MRHIQTLGNDKKDVILDCESGFHQSEDKRKLRSSYVTSILITKLTFAVFAQTEYIIRCHFSLCSISFVAFMREVMGVFCGQNFERECIDVLLNKFSLCVIIQIRK